MGPSNSVQVDLESPLKTFTSFFDEILFDIFIKESNKFATQRGANLDVTKVEMAAFFGILIIMGFHTLPSIRLYWSTDINFKVERISEIMPMKRFLKILRYFHIADNSQMPKPGDPNHDKLYKIRPLINYLNLKFKDSFCPSRWLSVDESMVKFKGRSSLKTIKRGFKVWAVCDSKTGYALGLDVYTGKKGDEVTLGLGERVVMDLTEPYFNRGFGIYFDNCFFECKLGRSLIG